MIFLRIDRDPNPDDQSYYDVGDAGSGNWGVPNAFSNKEKAIEYLRKSGIDDATINERLTETRYGWQFATPAKSLFGISLTDIIDDDSSESGDILTMLDLFIRPNMYLQVFEGKIANEDFDFDTSVGSLFVPVRMIACYKIPNYKFEEYSDEWDDFMYRLKGWLNQAVWSVNPFNASKSRLTEFLLQAYTHQGNDWYHGTSKLENAQSIIRNGLWPAVELRLYASFVTKDLQYALRYGDYVLVFRDDDVTNSRYGVTGEDIGLKKIIFPVEMWKVNTNKIIIRARDNGRRMLTKEVFSPEYIFSIAEKLWSAG
jgi:hypothetical protein